MNDQFHGFSIIVFRNDQVLLVRHGEKSSHLVDSCGLPGGRKDKEESEKETAVRETFEETGLTIKTTNLHEFPNNIFSAFIKRKIGPSGIFTMKVFMTTKFTSTLKKSGETEPIWIKISELNTYDLLPNVEKAVIIASTYRNSIMKNVKS
jgi:ADP-ribose pyrophosphatase YjhB (NUDIX family)